MSDVKDEVPMVILEPWFAEFLDPSSPPLSFDEVLCRKNALGVLDTQAPTPAHWRINFTSPSTGVWTDESVAYQPQAVALALIQYSISTTPGMLDIVREWTRNHRMGAQAPSERIPLLPRESGVYDTTMTTATDAERATMRAYDEKIANFLTTTEIPLAACGRIIEMFYDIRLPGVVGMFVCRLLNRLDNLLDNYARRHALDMVSYDAFETKEVEAATLAACAADERGTGGVSIVNEK